MGRGGVSRFRNRRTRPPNPRPVAGVAPGARGELRHRGDCRRRARCFGLRPRFRRPGPLALRRWRQFRRPPFRWEPPGSGASLPRASGHGPRPPGRARSRSIGARSARSDPQHHFRGIPQNRGAGGLARQAYELHLCGETVDVPANVAETGLCRVGAVLRAQPKSANRPCCSRRPRSILPSTTWTGRFPRPTCRHHAGVPNKGSGGKPESPGSSLARCTSAT